MNSYITHRKRLIKVNRAWILLAPSLFVMAITAVLPLVIVINYSVQDSFAGDQFYWVGLRWFEEIIHSPDFWAAAGRTLVFSAIVISIQFTIGVFVARKLFFKHQNPNFFIVLFSVPMLTPWLVVGFLWRIMMDPDIGPLSNAIQLFGITPDLNSVGWSWLTIVVMDVWHWTGLIIVLTFSGYLSIPESYFQAARIDQASAWRTFRYVEVPKLRKVLIIALLLRFMDSFMIYIEPFMVTRGGPDRATTFMSLELIQTASIQFDLGKAGAMSVYYLIVMITICWILFRAMGLGAQSTRVS